MSGKIKKFGTLFWITGLSGSGKTTLAKRILPFLKKKYGPTIHFDGDQIRTILNLNGYSLSERKSYSRIYNKISKYITDQNINVVFSIVGLMDEPRLWNRKNIKKYVEIFIKTDLKKLKKINIRNTYSKKNVVGINIKPKFPKNPHIIINNDFKRNLKSLENELKKK